MKPVLVLIGLSLGVVTLLPAQPCYQKALEEAEVYYQQNAYEEAVNLYLTALLCDDKPEKEDLPQRIKNALNARVQQLKAAIIRARNAESEARQLANKADTLRSYLQGDSTYAVYFKNGKEKFRNGRYTEALRDFAIARFTKETRDIKEWIKITQQGLTAERLALNGELNQSFEAFKLLPSLDTADHRARRLQHIQVTRYKWLESIQEKDLSTLDTLYLIYDMHFLPAGLSQCTQLKTLFLSENALWQLPAESWLVLTKLPQLETLDLSGNQLWCLAPESWHSLTKLTRLRHLVLSDNKLAQLPPQSWTQLAQFSNLEILDLSRNELTKIPEEMSQLTNLKKLLLIENQLPTDPADWQFLKNLPNLQVVDVRLNNLPPETLAYISTLLPPDCLVFVD
ncbi:MAG: leucine-rich repeat domain-containing protein [Saprospiraceae bacterium]